ncbi:MAG TPA: ABC transporter permease [Planctomycetes bacterium]|nr:ABC transporter permease [Planctomycetota bacterium]HIN80982.1 ABC transporter permease [Planctomycetota bacterium]
MTGPVEFLLFLLGASLLSGVALHLSDRLLRSVGAIGAVARVLLAEGMRRGAIPIALLILFAGLLALPDLLSENRIVEYRVQSLLQYGQAWISVVLMTLTVLLGCGSLSEEIAARRLDVTLTKPVGRGRYLLGKWLGLVLIDGVLLAVAISLLLVLIPRCAGEDHLDAIPAADRVVEPLLPAVTDEQVADFLERGRVTDPDRWDSLSADEAKQRARGALSRSARSIQPGSERSYRFEVPPRLPEGSVLALRPYLGRSTHRSIGAVLEILSGDQIHGAIVGNAELTEIPLPAGPVEQPLEITIAFKGAVEEGVDLPAILWAGRDSIRLRIPDDSLAANIARSSLMLWLRLAFTAALSTVAVTVLGFPVATLSLFIFLVTASTGSLLVIDGSTEVAHAHSHGQEVPRSFGKEVLEALALIGEWVVVALSDWERHDASSTVSTGILVPGSDVLRCLGVIGLLWTGLSLFAGRWLLRRRELGGASP